MKTNLLIKSIVLTIFCTANFFASAKNLLSDRLAAIKNSNHKNHIKKESQKRDKVVCITLPKCGTHLLIRCLTLFNIPGIHYNTAHGVTEEFRLRMRELNKNLPPNHYKGPFHVPTVGPLPEKLLETMKGIKKRSVWSHWPYTKECEREFNRQTSSNFFIIRDPRDQVVSFAFMVHKHPDGRVAPINDLILDLIDGRQKNYVPWATEIHNTYPLLWEGGIVEYYKLYLPWMNAKNFYTVKFENLVGPQGGGTLDLQVNEIRNMAAHLGVALSDEKIMQVINELFGGTCTFREGQIGSWKKHFTPEMKEAFKKLPGACELLIELGYEKDSNW